MLDDGKMYEKQVHSSWEKVAMMAKKDVRPLLSAMSSDCLIFTQEVPKSADHNPPRTFYLWHVDLNRAYFTLLGSLYKTSFNISARCQAEPVKAVSLRELTVMHCDVHGIRTISMSKPSGDALENVEFGGVDVDANQSARYPTPSALFTVLFHRVAKRMRGIRWVGES